MTAEAKRATGGEPPGHQDAPGRGPPLGRAWGPPLGRAWGPPGGPGSPPALPFRVYDLSDLKILGDASKKYFAASGAETTEREKLSGREKSVGEIPSPRGEIVAIIIVIATGFIGIIIHTILTDSTIISTAPLCSDVTSRVILVVVHWDHFSGVDCLV